MLATPEWIIDSRADELGRAIGRSTELVARRLERAGDQLGELRGQLRALSPQRTLDRGYAIVQRDTGSILRDAADAAAGEHLLLMLAAGSVSTTVDAAGGVPGGGR